MANHLASPVSRVLRRPSFFRKARAQPEQPRRLVVGLHLRDHLLHQLVLADLDAEGLALLRVLRAGVAAGADQAGGAGGHRVAPLIEREHRDLEALARLADEVLRRHLDVVHLEEAGVAGEDAPLLLERAAREALEGALDDEGADAGRCRAASSSRGRSRRRPGSCRRRRPARSTSSRRSGRSDRPS